jgi:hypothetical protein
MNVIESSAIDYALIMPNEAANLRSTYAELRIAGRTTLDLALRYGRDLLEVQTRFYAEHGRGQWVAWVESQCDIKARRAQKYMRLWRRRKRLPRDEIGLGVAAAIEAVQSAPRALSNSEASKATLPEPADIKHASDAIQGKKLARTSLQKFVWISEHLRDFLISTKISGCGWPPQAEDISPSEAAAVLKDLRKAKRPLNAIIADLKLRIRDHKTKQGDSE